MFLKFFLILLPVITAVINLPISAVADTLEMEHPVGDYAVSMHSGSSTSKPSPVGHWWAKTLGGSLEDIGMSAQQTSDGGYIVGGYTKSSGAGDIDLWVLRLNPNATVAWQKTYGGVSDDVARSIHPTVDGGYIVAGYTNSSGAGGFDFLVMKLSADGTVVWQKTYGGASDDFAFSVQQTQDGGYIVAGYTASSGAGDFDVWILKLNADGTITWQKTYGGTLLDSAWTVRETSDGGYIVAGFTKSSGAGDFDIWILKLDADGTVAWQKTYGGAMDDWALSVDQTTHGGYIVSGNTISSGVGSADSWILMLNSDGTIAWQNTYGGPYWDELISIQQSTLHDSFIAAGFTNSSGAGGDDVWLVRLNFDGTIAWQKTYGGASQDWAFSVRQTAENGYVVTGFAQLSGAGGSDFWALNLNYNGDIGGTCSAVAPTYVTPVQTFVSDANSYISPADTSVNDVGSALTASSAFTATEVTQCSGP